MTWARRIAIGLLAVAYFFVGVGHLRTPGFFMPIVPGWVPYPYQTILVTGVCELFGAVGLLIPRTRRWAGIMLALYAVCVFPANIKHAIDDLSSGTGLSWWYHAPRLAAQPLLVWWALYAGGVSFGSDARHADRNRAVATMIGYARR